MSIIKTRVHLSNSAPTFDQGMCVSLRNFAISNFVFKKLKRVAKIREKIAGNSKLLAHVSR